MSNRFILSPKAKAFIKHKSPVEFMEGTTASGKTTVGAFKFIKECFKSSKKQHIIAGLDEGTIEKNIIQKDLGILDCFGDYVEYFPNGKDGVKMAHLRLHRSNKTDKIVFVCGYGDQARWKKILGGQYGCVYIDEINIADMDFVREISMRCDYMLATLNPDSPQLDIYSEYINHARPLEKWNDAPSQLLDMLDQPINSNYTWWYFSFEDNYGLSEEKKIQIKSSVPKGTKQYKNKIQGLRGRATGLVFPNFDEKKHVVSAKWLKKQIDKGEIKFECFSAGLDTSYSSKSRDTIAMLFMGITDEGKLFILEEKIYNNKVLDEPVAPSDIAKNFIDFLDRCNDYWTNGKIYCKNTFIDCADQATITELLKYKRSNGCIYIFNNSYKKTKIIDRIKLQMGWIHSGHYYVVDSCINHIIELQTYSYDEKKDNTPEDANDHTINAGQYGWLPFKESIGDKIESR
ncbi:MAG: hypothetical protein NC213_10305 [Acetobacter sp.]|nr:hypothetical protein [Bacteroides sp.]MCM1342126.1 hypothetical protein [Acetobacter sp.]